jgi:hypothetical protein
VDLPTFDEVVGPVVAAKDFNSFILDRFTESKLNVYTIHAEVEGILMANDFRQLLAEAGQRGIDFKPWATCCQRTCPPCPSNSGARRPEGREGWLGCSRHEQTLGIPLLLLAFALFYLLPLGTHGLWIPDETRYADQPGNAAERQLGVAALHGVRYFEKPAAGYWMIAMARLFGQNLFGVRFASA